MAGSSWANQALSTGSAGAAFGPWGALIGTVGGATSGLFRGMNNGFGDVMAWITDPAGMAMGAGNTPEGPQNPYVINQDQVNAWTNQLNQYLTDNRNLDMSNYNSMKSWLGRGEGYMGRASGLLDQIAGFKSNATYDPMSATRQFLSMAPQLQQVARESVGSGTTEGDLAQLQSQALRDVAAQYGPDAANSGAFNQSAIEAMAQPRFQAAQQTQALQSQAAQSLLNQYMSQAEQAQQFGTNTQFQREQLGLNALGSAAQGYSGLTNAAMQGAGIYGNIYNQQLSNQQSERNALLSMLNSINEPMWYTPPYMTGGAGGGGMADMAGMAELLIKSGAASALKNRMSSWGNNPSNSVPAGWDFSGYTSSAPGAAAGAAPFNY